MTDLWPNPGASTGTMGACQSIQDSEEEENKKRSRAIDARLEEDSRRLRRECKILLLGKRDRRL